MVCLQNWSFWKKTAHRTRADSVALARANAIAVLDDLGITAVEDLRRLEDLAWARGILVREGAIGGAEARLTVRGRRGVITVSSQIDNRHRRRYAIAHEIGHFEMHRGESQLSVCVAEDINRRFGTKYDAAVQREVQANEFASHLLVPDRMALPMVKGIKPSMRIAKDLSDGFDVSLTAAALAYMRMCNEICAVVYSQDGQVKWFVASKDFRDLGFFVELGPIDGYTIAADFFRKRPIADAQMSVDTVSWLAPGRFDRDSMIKEHSIPMPAYNAVLSLLWVDKDIGF